MQCFQYIFNLRNQACVCSLLDLDTEPYVQCGSVRNRMVYRIDSILDYVFNVGYVTGLESSYSYMNVYYNSVYNISRQ
jgi:hypothetical protein